MGKDAPDPGDALRAMLAVLRAEQRLFLIEEARACGAFLSEMNRGRWGGRCRAGCYCELFISGASGRCLPAAQRHVMAAPHSVFSMGKNLSRRVGYVILRRRLFFISKCHSPSCGSRGKGGGGVAKEQRFEKLSLVRISDVAVSISFSRSLCLSHFYLSLFIYF